jgi:hypothetical protein
VLLLGHLETLHDIGLDTRDTTLWIGEGGGPLPDDVVVVLSEKISPTEDELEQCTLTWVYATAEISVTGHELKRFWLY